MTRLLGKCMSSCYLAITVLCLAKIQFVLNSPSSGLSDVSDNVLRSVSRLPNWKVSQTFSKNPSFKKSDIEFMCMFRLKCSYRAFSMNNSIITISGYKCWVWICILLRKRAQMEWGRGRRGNQEKKTSTTCVQRTQEWVVFSHCFLTVLIT